MADLLSAVFIPIEAFHPFVLGIYLAKLYWALCLHFSCRVLFNPHNDSFSVSGSQWAVILHLGRHLVMSGDVRGCHNPGEGCSWHLISKDLRCCSCSAQSRHSQQKTLACMSTVLQLGHLIVGAAPSLIYQWGNWDSVVMWLSAVTQLVSSGSARAWVLTTVLDGLVTSPFVPILCLWAPLLPLNQTTYLSSPQPIVLTLTGSNMMFALL